jgi:hypothetical protein
MASSSFSPVLLISLVLPRQYYMMTSPIPMYLPAALDPLAALLLIRSYRWAAYEIVRRWLGRPSSTSSSVVVGNGGGNTATMAETSRI